MAHILFITPYPYAKAASQRFRFEQYYTILLECNYTYHQAPFLGEKAWNILYQRGKKIQKGLYILIGFLKRFLLLFTLYKYDIVFIHREASPIGPPIFEWLIVKVFGKKVIYDFDDAIWLSNTSVNNQLVSKIKWHSKVKLICKWAHKVSCGNAYLAAFARQHNDNVYINPTTIDTENCHNKVKNQHTQKMVIGWTGSHSTMNYLLDFILILDKLQERYTFTFQIISDEVLSIERDYIEYISWNKDSEIEDLLSFNIGVMPLKEDKWSKGKCGFKALQYMALGIPAVVSSIGVNKEIVCQGTDGFLCDGEREWLDTLAILINSTPTRTKIGKAARNKIMSSYSVKSNKSTFLPLFLPL